MLINLQTKKIPVPFMGGKILARPTLTEVLYILGCREELSEMTVIDFFGGSGLLSQWCIEAGFKHVVWNDFDDYQGRIRYYMTDRYRDYVNWAARYLYEELKIEQRTRVHDPHAEPIRQRLLEEFRWAEENGFEESSVSHLLLCGVGFTTGTNKSDPRRIPKCRIYSNIPKGGWRQMSNGWCEKAERVCCDYRELLNRDINDKTPCLIDPPYPDTITHQYKNGSITLEEISKLVSECTDRGAKVVVFGDKASGIYDTITKDFFDFAIKPFMMAAKNPRTGENKMDYCYYNF